MDKYIFLFYLEFRVNKLKHLVGRNKMRCKKVFEWKVKDEKVIEDLDLSFYSIGCK